jgi:hypothetical protein
MPDDRAAAAVTTDKVPVFEFMVVRAPENVAPLKITSSGLATEPMRGCSSGRKRCCWTSSARLPGWTGRAPPVHSPSTLVIYQTNREGLGHARPAIFRRTAQCQ